MFASVAHRSSQPIEVCLRGASPDQHLPAWFRRGTQAYRIHAVQAIYRLSGRWWDGEGERTIYRVEAAPVQEESRLRAGVYELCYDHGRSEWLLTAIHD
jgi:hypothetical protein